MTTKIEESRNHAEACQECRYYQEYEDMEPEDKEDDTDLTGVCRRYPPQINLAYPAPISVYPDVSGPTGWCGEFTPKL